MEKPNSGHRPAVEVAVEIDPGRYSGDLSPQRATPEDFRKRAAEVAETIAEIAKEFQIKLAESMHERAAGLAIEAVEIEFGINLKAETGIVIAKATAGTTFTARMTLKSGR